jgi:hypothetical protein
MGVEYSESPERPDQIESFSVTPRVPFNHLPDPAQLLYRRMLMAFDHCERLVNIVSTNIAVHVRNGLPAPCMEGEFRYWSRLQVNYSRPAEVTAPFINDAHEDGDFLTFACATAPGLEISLPSGEFVEPLNPPGTVLILPGEIVSLLSGGVIQPLYHRVRPNPMYSERLSLLFFADLDPRNCKAWVVNEKNAGVDIGARVLKSVARFGLHAFPPSTH